MNETFYRVLLHQLLYFQCIIGLEIAGLAGVGILHEQVLCLAIMKETNHFLFFFLLNFDLGSWREGQYCRLKFHHVFFLMGCSILFYFIAGIVL